MLCLLLALSIRRPRGVSRAIHNLRHSYGTALAAQGVPMRTLQEWMGHRDIATTQRYADYCPNPHEREVVEAAFARGTNPGTDLRAPVGN
jgi:site-specific recombinase XerD